MSRVAHAYSSFAAENPVLYDAMFTRATRLRFAAEDTPIQLRAGFAELREAVANVAGGRDVETLTEVLWAALHGLTTLGRSDRLRPGRDTERIELLVAQFYDASRKGHENCGSRLRARCGVIHRPYAVAHPRPEEFLPFRVTPRRRAAARSRTRESDIAVPMARCARNERILFLSRGG